jgi:hypothetical protein
MSALISVENGDKKFGETVAFDHSATGLPKHAGRDSNPRSIAG